MEIARHTNRFKLRQINTDILKGLYELLIDPAQRHDLGEYYTPDWLAEGIVETVITKPLKDRVIDPACGSGTFLFHAVRRLLAFSENAAKAGADAVALACEKIAGIDIHPVAVIFARATHLLALQPTLITGRPPSFGIPVYLGDALQWNAREFMNQRDLEIVVPAAGESADELLGEDRDDDTGDGRVILRFAAGVAAAEPSLFDATLDEMLRLAERKHTPPALARTRRALQCPRPRSRRPQTTTGTGHPATLDRRAHHRRPRRSRSPATIRRSARPVPPAHDHPLPASGRHDRCRPHRQIGGRLPPRPTLTDFQFPLPDLSTGRGKR